jgi:hypothetical protein
MYELGATPRYDFDSAVPTALVCRNLAACIFTITEVIAKNSVTPYVNIDFEETNPHITLLLDISRSEGWSFNLETLDQHFTVGWRPKDFQEIQKLDWLIFGGTLPVSPEKCDRFLKHFAFAKKFCLTIGYPAPNNAGTMLPAPDLVKPILAETYTTLKTEAMLPYVIAIHQAGQN